MKVLVVEDSPGHAALVSAQLGDAAPGEFEVLHAASLTEALDLLLGATVEAPDVVLLDLGLPEADGLETLGQIRTAALGVPVVVLSGHDDDALAAAVVGEGAQDYLVKGVDGRTLARSLRHSVERGRRERALARRALHDGLTGLPNRTLFYDRLRQALSRLGRTQSCLAVMFLDLDGFKQVNDQRGHAAGDMLLVDVAERLGGALRGGDTAARLGGDEFVVLAEDITGVAEAARIARRLHRKLGARASMGVAFATDPHVEPQELVRTADAAMYVAKGRGGGQVEVAGEELADPDDADEHSASRRVHRPRPVLDA